MALKSQLDRPDIERVVLEVIGALLAELGSNQAARKVSLASALERDLGLGSLERVELLVRLEKRFDRRLPDTLAQSAETPEDWVRALCAAAASKPARERYRVEQPARDASPAPESARTWVEVLRHHAALEPDRVHIHLLEGDSGQDITYGKLLEMASRVAAGLRERGLRSNDTVAIMLPTSSDFFYAFFGVMLAGGVAVPIYPPARPDKIEEYVQRQVKILRNAEVRYLISFDRVRTVSKLMTLGLSSLLGVASIAELDATGDEGAARLRSSDVQAADIAFIQYTSGSTGDPKGVVLTQSNVLANVRGIGWSVKFRPDDAVVTWLPLYHDMGLIGSWLFSVYHGAPITVLSPLDFLSRPERWLWALHDSGGTLCPAPNFAYELCARKIREEALRGLDLSRWRVAINAGEAVLPETLARFAERFAPYGFRSEAFVPCYGLAESSVALTFPAIDREPVIDSIDRDTFTHEGRAVSVNGAGPQELPLRSARTSWREGGEESGVVRFVANGTPLPGHEVRLVDEDGRAAGERVQGRILFRGPSRTPGYYRNPEATAAVIDGEGWMDSGDLGYWAGGELFVTGRAKDLIIKAGHNIVPQEIEAAAAEVSGVRRGCVAAFGSRDPQSGTERVVVAAETRESDREQRKRIESEIVRRVSAAAVPPDLVILIPPQSIPKTSSGKIRRNETRRLFEAGKLGGPARSPGMQVASLLLRNVRAWGERRAHRLHSTAYRAYVVAAWGSTLPFTTLLGSDLAGSSRKARWTRSAARWLLRVAGESVRVEGAHALNVAGPALLVANRSGPLDALILAAVSPRPFVLADSGDIAFMPRPAASLLRHLTLRPLAGAAEPTGGRLRDRIRRALEEGCTVLVLPDNAATAPTRFSRYRLDSFHAAVLTSTPIVPVGIRGTEHVLNPTPLGLHRRATITVGQPIDAGSCSERELVELRDRVRAKIAELVR